MNKVKETFCRICEPFCPMLAEVDEEGKAVRLSPNVDHPYNSRPCHKGLSFLEVHNDPDRLNWPLKRLNPRTEPEGNFERVSWEAAIKGAGEKLNAVRDKYGKNAVAVYSGNPIMFNTRVSVLAGQFAGIIDSQMMFTPGTQDCVNKFSGSMAVFGTVFFCIPDLYNTDYLLCIGANPKVSRWTLIQVPNDGGAILKSIKDRGGKVCFVNPRKTESSTPETGDTLRIKPDTDVYFLAGVLNEIHLSGGFDQDFLNQYARNVDGLIDFIAQYPADRVEAITGISAAEIREVASDLVNAKSAAAYLSTGLAQGRQGTLCYLLTEMINVTTGNYGRKGGVYRSNGLNNALPAAVEAPAVKTSLGDLPVTYGFNTLPMSYLPELIESGDIRALLCLGGNPLITGPGGEKLRRALGKLDALVTVDIMHNELAELSDFVLPSSDWLEREDVNVLSSNVQLIPSLQYTDKVVEPAEERRNDWWILSRLLQELGGDSPLADPNHRDGMKMFDEALAPFDLSVDKLRELPHRTHFFDQGPYDLALKGCLNHEDKKIDCFPAVLVQQGLMERCETLFEELAGEDQNTLKLISLRTTHMHNSWMVNVAKLRRGRQAVNPLNMCTEDAKRLGLFDGDRILVSNQYGKVETNLLVNDDLRPGAVAMTHGYGRQKLDHMKIANSKPGANYNQLLPMFGDKDAFEPVSAMTWMCGVPVSVERIEH